VAEELERRQKLIKWGAIGSAIGMLLILVALHFFVMPLDMAFYKLLNRLG